MRRQFPLMLVAIFVATFAVAGGDNAYRAERRVALVIGNASYASGPLRNPVNDARAIAMHLRGLGFHVIARENLKTREISGVYREFRGAITRDAVALVFYAGHGVQFKGQNYFPATDSVIHSEDDVPQQSLHLSTLLNMMEESRAAVSLVFLDACRDNPFARSFRSGSIGMARVEAAAGTLIHYATRPGSVAADGNGKHGTYTEALLAHLSEPNLPVELMLKRVANRVAASTGGRQEPWMEGSLRGEFLFRRSNDIAAHSPATASAPATGRPVAADDPDTALWLAVEKAGGYEDYEVYLRQFARGKYSGLAQQRMQRLRDEAQHSVSGRASKSWSVGR